MKNYETIFILDPALGDDKATEEIDRATSVIKSAKGEVLDVQRWGKRKLAYEIKKKREGIYTLVRFKGTGGVVSELERSFRISEPVLRFLTVVDTGEASPSAAAGIDEKRTREPMDDESDEDSSFGDGHARGSSYPASPGPGGGSPEA